MSTIQSVLRQFVGKKVGVGWDPITVHVRVTGSHSETLTEVGDDYILVTEPDGRKIWISIAHIARISQE